jgi:acyl-coenzyme A synthetase/AMP-(fatty) acid ligase
LPRSGVKAPRALDLTTEEPALVIATSGSTGAPKFPWFDLHAVARSAQRIAKYMGLRGDDVVALVQPLEHGYGLVGQLFAALSAGARVVWARRPFFDEQAAVIDGAGATVLSSVPFALGRLLEAGLRGRSLRHVGSAGGPLHPRTAQKVVERFPASTVWNQYGCTEAGPRLTACPHTDPGFARGSVGRAIEGVTLRLVGDEIAFGCDTAMHGYLGDDAATGQARAGQGSWKTGDLGEIDGAGLLYVHGRVDDVVKYRGSKVALGAIARAIEACGAHGAIAWLRGEEEPELVAAYEADADIPKRAVGEHLPLESLPARLVRVDALPRLSSGKIDRAKAKSLI